MNSKKAFLTDTGFIIRQGRKPTQAIQVCCELTGRSEKREIASLVSACPSLGLTSGIILTFDQDKTLEKDGVKISVRPVREWLLEAGMDKIT